VYRFLVSPRWILSHAFVTACVIGMIAAGIWQLNRLDERRSSNRQILSAQDLPAASLDEVVPDGVAATPEQVEAAQYRTVVATGTYLADEQVLVQNRTYEGAPGYWVLTPLVLEGGGPAVTVNRGWVPYDVQPDGPWDAFAPPTGVVTVTGLVRQPQVRSTGGIVASPEDAAEGELRVLARVDVARLDAQVDEDLLPLYVELRTQDPAQSDGLPVPVPTPELSDGPHLGYAGQWFIFALLTVIVYPLLVRRVARNKAAARRAAEAGERGDGTDGIDGDEGGPVGPHESGSATVLVDGR
jgi:surfeit locus 1 family protein